MGELRHTSWGGIEHTLWEGHHWYIRMLVHRAPHCTPHHTHTSHTHRTLRTLRVPAGSKRAGWGKGWPADIKGWQDGEC